MNLPEICKKTDNMQVQTVDKLWNKNFLNVCLSSFFIFTNFYLLTATMPIYVKNDLQGSATHISLIVSLYILGTVLLRPFTGKWADQYGKRKVALLFLILFIICNVAYLGTKAIVPLLIVRFINGFGFSAATTSTAALAMDWIPSKRKGEGVGYFGLFMSLAMVVGPALGIFLASNYDYSILLIVASIFSILSIIFSFLTSEKPKEDIQNIKKPVVKGLDQYIERKALPICFAAFLLAFAYSSIVAYIALYFSEIGQAKYYSMFYFICLAVVIIITRPKIGKIYDKKGANTLVYPGLILLAIGLLIIALSNSPYILLLSGAIIGLGYGAVFPAFQTLCISAAGPERAGTASATFFLLYDIGIGLGSFVFGMISSNFGFEYTYSLAAIIAICCLASYFFIIHKKHKRNKIIIE